MKPIDPKDTSVTKKVLGTVQTLIFQCPVMSDICLTSKTYPMPTDLRQMYFGK